MEDLEDKIYKIGFGLGIISLCYFLFKFIKWLINDYGLITSISYIVYVILVIFGAYIIGYYTFKVFK